MQDGTPQNSGLQAFVARDEEERTETGRLLDLLVPGVPLEVGLADAGEGVHHLAIHQPEVARVVRHVAAGPYEGLSKEDLPGQLCAFAAGTKRGESTDAMRPRGRICL